MYNTNHSQAVKALHKKTVTNGEHFNRTEINPLRGGIKLAMNLSLTVIASAIPIANTNTFRRE